MASPDIRSTCQPQRRGSPCHRARSRLHPDPDEREDRLSLGALRTFGSRRFRPLPRRRRTAHLATHRQTAKTVVTAAGPSTESGQRARTRRHEPLVAATRAAAGGELIAAGSLDGAHVSPAARDLPLEHLGDLLARYQRRPGPVTVTDPDLELTVHVTPLAGAATVLRADEGAVTIDDLIVHVHAAGRARPDQVTTE